MLARHPELTPPAPRQERPSHRQLDYLECNILWGADIHYTSRCNDQPPVTVYQPSPRRLPPGSGQRSPLFGWPHLPSQSALYCPDHRCDGGWLVRYSQSPGWLAAHLGPAPHRTTATSRSSPTLPPEAAHSQGEPTGVYQHKPLPLLSRHRLGGPDRDRPTRTRCLVCQLARWLNQDSALQASHTPASSPPHSIKTQDASQPTT